MESPRCSGARDSEPAEHPEPATRAADCEGEKGGDDKDGEEEEKEQELEEEDHKVLNVSPCTGPVPWQGETTPSFLTGRTH